MKRLRFLKIFSLLNLHFFVLGLLAVLNLFLCARLFMALHTLHAAGPEQIAERQTSYRTLQLQMRPLLGLPEKVAQARGQANDFYDQRFPSAYSTISAAINDLAAKNNVRQTRLAYTQTPAIQGLAEVRMDASLSGEYASLMHFINGLERSKTFFVIDGLTLTGQQGGLVNLRLRLTTYLHAADLDRISPPQSQQSDAAAGEGNR
jgi:type IV pilus assembly protein PilO